MKRYVLVLMTLITFFSCHADNDGVNKNQPEIDMDIVEAVQSNNLAKVKQLLAQGANVESTGAKERTLLMIATYSDYVEMARLLVEAGADVNAQDDMKNSPFLYAGAEGKLELVKLYLNYNPNFNLYNRFGGTALIPAAEKGHPEVVELLANIPGYPIDHVNNLGWTALMEAIVLGNGNEVQTRIVQILVDAGVDVNIPDSKGISALTHARNSGFSNIVRILEEASKR